MSNNLPNFLIPGAAKAGTTSLYNYLNSHPEIFMSPVKEPLFFTLDSYKNISRNDPRHKVADRKMARMASLKDYQGLFESVTDRHKATGEASVPYLYHYQMAITEIKKVLGDPKIIIILRNPIERAFSSYNHLLEEGAETVTFEEFLNNEAQKKLENWDILNYPVSLGLYYSQVKAYMENFSQVKVLLLEDLKANPVMVMQELYTFLEVSSDFIPDTTKVYNKTPNKLSGSALSSVVANFLSHDNTLKLFLKRILSLLLSQKNLYSLKQSMRVYSMRKPKIKPQTRERLGKEFAEDILKLQTLIGRDLSCWS